MSESSRNKPGGAPCSLAHLDTLYAPPAPMEVGQMVDNTAQIDALLEEQEHQRMAKQAEIVNAKLNELDSHVLMLRGMGVDVSVTLDAPTTRPLDKIEKVGSTKEIGWYAYVDFLDEDGTKRRIDAAKAAAAYAANGGA